MVHIFTQYSVATDTLSPYGIPYGYDVLRDGGNMADGGWRPEYPDHVWSYDFMLERTHDGRTFRLLNVIDEYSRECLAIRVGRNPDHEDVQECLAELFYTYGDP